MSYQQCATPAKYLPSPPTNDPLTIQAFCELNDVAVCLEGCVQIICTAAKQQTTWAMLIEGSAMQAPCIHKMCAWACVDPELFRKCSQFRTRLNLVPHWEPFEQHQTDGLHSRCQLIDINHAQHHRHFTSILRLGSPRENPPQCDHHTKTLPRLSGIPCTPCSQIHTEDSPRPYRNTVQASQRNLAAVKIEVDEIRCVQD